MESVGCGQCLRFVCVSSIVLHCKHSSRLPQGSTDRLKDFIGNALLQETVNNGWQRQDSGNDGIFHHCIEYLTQTTMCAVDAALEKATIKIDPGSVYRWRPSGVLTNTTMHQCRDIRKVIQFASAHTILGRI